MWQQVEHFCCFHSFCSSDWISQDPKPSYGHLLSSWFTGGFVHTALICLASLFNISLHSAHRKAPDIVMRQEYGSKRCKKAFGRHFPPCLNPALGAWAKRLRFCSSTREDTVPGPHLSPAPRTSAAAMRGRDKRQQDAHVFSHQKSKDRFIGLQGVWILIFHTWPNIDQHMAIWLLYFNTEALNLNPFWFLTRFFLILACLANIEHYSETLHFKCHSVITEEQWYILHNVLKSKYAANARLYYRDPTGRCVKCSSLRIRTSWPSTNPL